MGNDTSLIIPVAEAAFIQPVPERYLHRHITMRAPFKPLHELSEDDYHTLATLCASFAPFPFTLARLARFAESGVFSTERPANFLLTASLGLSVFFRLALGHLFFGGAVVILPEFRNVIDLVKALASWDNALCYLPAEMCRFLLSCAPAEGHLLPNMRALIGGGGFLYRQEKLALLDRVTPHSTGPGRTAACSRCCGRPRCASVGRRGPAPSGIEVQVVGGRRAAAGRHGRAAAQPRNRRRGPGGRRALSRRLVLSGRHRP